MVPSHRQWCTKPMNPSVLALLIGAGAALLLSRPLFGQSCIRLEGPVYIYGDSQASRHGFGGGLRAVAEARGLRAVNNSHAGWSTSRLWRERDISNPGSYDTVFVITGANDGGRNYGNDLAALIRWLRSNGVRQVVYVAPLPLTRATDLSRVAAAFPRHAGNPDWALQDGRPEAQAVSHRLLSSVAEREGAIVMDVGALGRYPLAPDGIHATPETGREYAERLFCSTE